MMAWNDASASLNCMAGWLLNSFLPATPMKLPMTEMSGLNTFDVCGVAVGVCGVSGGVCGVAGGGGGGGGGGCCGTAGTCGGGTCAVPVYRRLRTCRTRQRPTADLIQPRLEGQQSLVVLAANGVKLPSQPIQFIP